MNKRKGKYVVALFSWCCFFDKLSLSLSRARMKYKNEKKCQFFSLVVFSLCLSLFSLSPLTQLNLSRLSLSLPLSRWFTMKKEYILKKRLRSLSLEKEKGGQRRKKRGGIFFLVFFIFFEVLFGVIVPRSFHGFPRKKERGRKRERTKRSTKNKESGRKRSGTRGENGKLKLEEERRGRVFFPLLTPRPRPPPRRASQERPRPSSRGRSFPRCRKSSPPSPPSRYLPRRRRRWRRRRWPPRGRRAWPGR